MVCKLDNHPKIAEVERSVKEGVMTITEAARELDSTYQETWKHFKECVKAPVENLEFEGYLAIMRELILKMKTRVDSLESTPTNAVSVKMLTSLVREIRGLVGNLAELEGRFQRSPLLQLTQINVKFEKLTAFMFTSLCDDCKLKLASQLEQMEPLKLEDHR